jgi:hypothetical protein
LTPVA